MEDSGSSRDVSSSGRGYGPGVRTPNGTNLKGTIRSPGVQNPNGTSLKGTIRSPGVRTPNGTTLKATIRSPGVRTPNGTTLKGTIRRSTKVSLQLLYCPGQEALVFNSQNCLK